MSPVPLQISDRTPRKLLSRWGKKAVLTRSRTARAAATEKIIYHNSVSQVNSGDLTADEFASMVGIRVQPPQDPVACFYPGTASLPHLPTSIDLTRCPSAQSVGGQLSIWDAAFWKTDDSRLSYPPSSIPLSFVGSTTEGSVFSESSATTADTLDNFAMSPSPSRHCSVIKKGRFRIIVGDNDEVEEPAEHFQGPKVVEWHRKRTCTV